MSETVNSIKLLEASMNYVAEEFSINKTDLARLDNQILSAHNIVNNLGSDANAKKNATNMIRSLEESKSRVLSKMGVGIFQNNLIKVVEDVSSGKIKSEDLVTLMNNHQDLLKALPFLMDEYEAHKEGGVSSTAQAVNTLLFDGTVSNEDLSPLLAALIEDDREIAEVKKQLATLQQQNATVANSVAPAISSSDESAESIPSFLDIKTLPESTRRGAVDVMKQIMQPKPNLSSIDTWFVNNNIPTNVSYFTLLQGAKLTGYSDDGERAVAQQQLDAQGPQYRKYLYLRTVATYQMLLDDGVPAEHIVVDVDAGLSAIKDEIFQQEKKDDEYIASVLRNKKRSPLVVKTEKYVAALGKKAEGKYPGGRSNVLFVDHYAKYIDMQKKMNEFTKTKDQEVERLKSFASTQRDQLRKNYCIDTNFEQSMGLLHQYMEQDENNPLDPGQLELIAKILPMMMEMQVPLQSEEDKANTLLQGLPNNPNTLMKKYGKVPYADMTEILQSCESLQPSNEEFNAYQSYLSQIQAFINDKDVQPWYYKVSADRTLGALYNQEYQKSFTTKAYPRVKQYFSQERLPDRMSKVFDSYIKGAKKGDMVSIMGAASMSAAYGIFGTLYKATTAPFTLYQAIESAMADDDYMREQLDHTRQGSIMGNVSALYETPESMSKPIYRLMKNADGSESYGRDRSTAPYHLLSTMTDMMTLIAGSGAVASRMQSAMMRSPKLLSRLGVNSVDDVSFQSMQSIMRLCNTAGTFTTSTYLHLGDNINTGRQGGLRGVDAISYGFLVSAIQSTIESMGANAMLEGSYMNPLLKQKITNEMKGVIMESGKKMTAKLGGRWLKEMGMETAEEVITEGTVTVVNALINKSQGTSLHISTYADYVNIVVLTALSTGMINTMGFKQHGSTSLLDQRISHLPIDQQANARAIQVELAKLVQDEANLANSSAGVADTNVAIAQATGVIDDVIPNPTISSSHSSLPTRASATATTTAQVNSDHGVEPGSSQNVEGITTNEKDLLNAITNDLEDDSPAEKARKRNNAKMSPDDKAKNMKIRHPEIVLDNTTLAILLEEMHQTGFGEIGLDGNIIGEVDGLYNYTPLQLLHKLREGVAGGLRIERADDAIREGYCGTVLDNSNRTPEEQLLIDKIQEVENFYDKKILQEGRKLVNPKLSNQYLDHLRAIWNAARDIMMTDPDYADINKKVEEGTLDNETAINMVIQLVTGNNNLTIDGYIANIIDGTRRNRELNAPSKSLAEKYDTVRSAADAFANYHKVTLDQVILPPDTDTGLGTGEQREQVTGHNYDRGSVLLDILQSKNIDLDTVELTDGIKGTRAQSYVAVYVPSLDKTIFVNNLYGQATYIVKGKLAETEMTTLTKTQLEAKKLAVKVEFNDGQEINRRETIEMVLFSTQPRNEIQSAVQVGAVLYEPQQASQLQSDPEQVETPDAIRAKIQTVVSLMNDTETKYMIGGIQKTKSSEESGETLEEGSSPSKKKGILSEPREYTFAEALQHTTVYQSRADQHNSKYPDKPVPKNYSAYGTLLNGLNAHSELIISGTEEIVSLSRPDVIIWIVDQLASNGGRMINKQEFEEFYRDLREKEEAAAKAQRAMIAERVNLQKQEVADPELVKKKAEGERFLISLQSYKVYEVRADDHNSKYPDRPVPKNYLAYATFVDGVNASNSKILIMGIEENVRFSRPDVVIWIVNQLASNGGRMINKQEFEDFYRDLREKEEAAAKAQRAMIAERVNLQKQEVTDPELVKKKAEGERFLKALQNYKTYPARADEHNSKCPDRPVLKNYQSYGTLVDGVSAASKLFIAETEETINFNNSIVVRWIVDQIASNGGRMITRREFMKFYVFTIKGIPLNKIDPINYLTPSQQKLVKQLPADFLTLATTGTIEGYHDKKYDALIKKIKKLSDEDRIAVAEYMLRTEQNPDRELTPEQKAIILKAHNTKGDPATTRVLLEGGIPIEDARLLMRWGVCGQETISIPELLATELDGVKVSDYYEERNGKLLLNESARAMIRNIRSRATLTDTKYGATRTGLEHHLINFVNRYGILLPDSDIQDLDLVLKLISRFGKESDKNNFIQVVGKKNTEESSDKKDPEQSSDKEDSEQPSDKEDSKQPSESVIMKQMIETGSPGDMSSEETHAMRKKWIEQLLSMNP